MNRRGSLKTHLATMPTSNNLPSPSWNNLPFCFLTCKMKNIVSIQACLVRILCTCLFDVTLKMQRLWDLLCSDTNVRVVRDWSGGALTPCYNPEVLKVCKGGQRKKNLASTLTFVESL